MGLRAIELVMDVEDAFDIAIPDETAEDIRTVGQLYQTVLGLLRMKNDHRWLSRPDLEEIVWQKLCTLSAKLARGVRPSDITPSTRFIEDLGYG